MTNNIHQGYVSYADRPAEGPPAKCRVDRRAKISDIWSPYEFLYYYRQEDPSVSLESFTSNPDMIEVYNEHKRELALEESAELIYHHIVKTHFSEVQYGKKYNTFSLLASADNNKDSADSGYLYGGIKELYYRVVWLLRYYEGIDDFHQRRFVCLERKRDAAIAALENEDGEGDENDQTGTIAEAKLVLVGSMTGSSNCGRKGSSREFNEIKGGNTGTGNSANLKLLSEEGEPISQTAKEKGRTSTPEDIKVDIDSGFAEIGGSLSGVKKSEVPQQVEKAENYHQVIPRTGVERRIPWINLSQHQNQ